MPPPSPPRWDGRRGRWPRAAHAAAVLSRSYSAAISASSKRPTAASRCTNTQRSSVSTARPSMVSRPSSSASRRSSCSGVRAVAAKARAQASWWSPCGLGRAQVGEGRVGPAGQQGLAGGRVGVQLDRQLHLPVQRLHDTDVGLLADAGQHQRQVVAGGELGVAGHVPGRGPAQGARQGGLEVAEVLGDERERVLVEADLGVRQVVVVEQDHVGAAPADELRYGGQLPVHVQFEALVTHQLAAAALGAVEVVQADRDAVRAQRRLALGAAWAGPGPPGGWRRR